MEKDYEGRVGGDLLGDGKPLLSDGRHYGWRGADDDSNDVDGIYGRELDGLLVDAASGGVRDSPLFAT